VLGIIVWTVANLLVSAAFSAGDSKTAATDNKTKDDPIQITADQLISNNEKKYAEFIGNVRATQAEFVITSDKLRIYYQGDLLNTEEKSNQSDDMLKKIVATGNVKIISSQYDAESDMIEYDTASMTITMTGENSKVISGKNSISGSKIILYRKEGRVKVLGSEKKRVEATFYSGGNASDAFKIEESKE
jgi:lipopolysaccharide transport protein LptA